MAHIAIIAAMEQELVPILNKCEITNQAQKYDLTFIEGRLSNADCIFVQCGIGKVNAARATQMLLDKYDISHVINVGSCGALNPALDFGDIIVSRSCLQHDFDISAFGHDKGYIPDVGRFLEADALLVSKCEKLANRFPIIIGTIATGDQFFNDPEIKQNLRTTFGADCDDMEGAAIAQVCKLCGVPFLLIRSVTDKPKDKSQLDFYTNLDMASQRCADFVADLLR